MPRTQRYATLALIGLFLCAGLVGHDPWKQDETYSFGIIWHFFTTHSWLVPTNAGVPFLEKPPLYYWTAVLFCKLFSGLLPLHDAARLTNLLYMAVTLAFLWKTSQVLFAGRADRQPLGWITLFLFLGSLGLVPHAHELFTDVALLTGATIALYGMALLLATPRWGQAGGWIGLGLGMAFLSKGVFVPGLFISTGLLLLALSAHRLTLLKALPPALLAALPFLLIWPALLYAYWPKLFFTWFWDNNIGRFFGFSVRALGAENEPYYFLRIIPVFALPAFPLALAEIIIGRTHWRKPAYALPLLLLGVGIATLLASASARALYLLPLLPAFSLLGAQGLVRIPPRWLTPWNGLVIVLFSAAAAVAWCVWWELLHPAAAGPLHTLLHFASRWLPLGYDPGPQPIAITAAAAFLLLWLGACLMREEAHTHAARLWLAGIALLWGTVMTLWLPWIDDTRSYHGLLLQMEQAAQAAAPGECIATYDLGESITPMLEYLDGHPSLPGGFRVWLCPLLVTAARHDAPEYPPSARGWKLIWKGSRPLDEKSEELRLYERR